MFLGPLDVFLESLSWLCAEKNFRAPESLPVAGSCTQMVTVCDLVPVKSKNKI